MKGLRKQIKKTKQKTHVVYRALSSAILTLTVSETS